jgi:hypothetical protein
VKYSRENAGGAIYTVDEVSGLLGIPRPTLYRYLREYSIPHLSGPIRNFLDARYGHAATDEDLYG